MIIDKESLGKKILPSLLRNRDGKRVLKEVQVYLEHNNLRLNDITKKFETAADFKSADFWGYFLGVFNGCFDVDLSFDEIDGKVKDFEVFLHELMRVRFDTIFEENEYKKIADTDALEKYCRNIEDNEDVITIKSTDSIRRIIIPFKRTYDENIFPNQPGSRTSYPNILLRIEDDRIAFDSSNKKRISTTIKSIENNKTSDKQSVLIEFSENNLDDLEVDVKNFFTNLKQQGFYPKQMKFDNKLFYFSTGSKSLIDYERLIDTEYYLNTILDFISIRFLKLAYTEEVNGKNRDFTLSIKTNIHDLGDEKGVLKFMLSINKSKFLSANIRQNIEHKLRNIGLEFNNAYDLPLEYYLNKLLYAAPNLKPIYEKIQSIESSNSVIKRLQAENILTTDPKIILNEEKLHKLIAKLLRGLNGGFKLSTETFTIRNVYLDNSQRICLDVKLSDETNKVDEYYGVILHDNIRSYDRVLKVIIHNFDKAFVLQNLIDGKNNRVLEYLNLRVKSYLQYEYGIQLGKEANRAHRWLNTYCKTFSMLEKQDDPKKLGGRVERELNVVLKYLFRNYKPLGGARKPDGFLFGSKSDNHLLDSKQHKDILIGEIDKVARYLFTYCAANNLPEAKNGILIVCRGKIGNSLNKSAVDEWKKSDYFTDNYSVSFITLEFILKLFDLFNKPKASMHGTIKKQLLDKFYYVAKRSQNISTSKKLIDIEDKVLKELNDIIREAAYMPSRDDEL